MTSCTIFENFIQIIPYKLKIWATVAPTKDTMFARKHCQIWTTLDECNVLESMCALSAIMVYCSFHVCGEFQVKNSQSWRIILWDDMLLRVLCYYLICYSVLGREDKLTTLVNFVESQMNRIPITVNTWALKKNYLLIIAWLHDICHCYGLWEKNETEILLDIFYPDWFCTPLMQLKT